MKERNGYRKHWKLINRLRILILEVWNLIMKWREITDFCLVNKIGAEGAKWISEALKVNKSITNIDMFCMKFDNENEMKRINWFELGNAIGAEGAKWISEALKVNKSITDINFLCMKFVSEMKWNEMK